MVSQAGEAGKTHRLKLNQCNQTLCLSPVIEFLITSLFDDNALILDSALSTLEDPF
ncbi:MAG: hypothetical protein ACI9WC_000435 [Arenicella sp.]|jgi:hypothetical protein